MLRLDAGFFTVVLSRGKAATGVNNKQATQGAQAVDNRILRRLLLISGLLAFTLLVGSIGFVALEHYPWFDAFYRALTTITTVGSPDAQPLSRPGKIFNSFLILFGVSVMFLGVGAVTQTVIELELKDIFGSRKRRRTIEKLEDHFIICGYGRVGRNASYEFKEAKARFLVLDRNPERVANATAAGILAVLADATQDESLRSAGVLRARGLIAALATDADNLFVILSVKALNPGLFIVTRASEEEAGKKLRRAGADIVLTPYSVAGRQLADALLRPRVIEFLDFARGNMGPGITMEQVLVGPHGSEGDRRLAEVPGVDQFGGIILALQRHGEETIFNPSREVQVASGDFLIVMGERNDLHRLNAALTQ